MPSWLWRIPNTMSLLVDQVKDVLAAQNVRPEQTRLLVGLSGGLDSTVLVNVLHRAGFKLVLAHVNYGLRGDASDGDEQFVRKLGAELNHPLEVCKIDLSDHTDTGESVQMTARRVRYDFFQELGEKHACDHLVVAHHREDQSETLLLNLLRGTGWAGWSAMKSDASKVLRPLLTISKEDLRAYAKANDIQWREDASNASVYYRRNALRQEVLPRLRAIEPALDEVLGQVASRSAAYHQVLQDLIARELGPQAPEKIALDVLRALSHPQVVLYECYRDFGFTWAQVQQMAAGLEGQSGTFYESQRWRVTRDRAALILSKRESLPFATVEIGSDLTRLESPVAFNISTHSASDYVLKPSAEVAAFDLDRLKFPLQLRPWQPGDRFQPLGLHGSKKVSDLLVDLKVSLPDKEKVLVLLSADEIVWVVGYRIAHPFRITAASQRVWELSLSTT